MIPLVRPIKLIHVSGFNGSRSLWSRGIIHVSDYRFLQEPVRMPSWNPYCFSQEAQKWCRIGEAAGTAQVSSSWGVAIRPGCGHCPSLPLRPGTVLCCTGSECFLCVRHETGAHADPRTRDHHCARGGRRRRGKTWKMHNSLSDGGVGGASFHQLLDAMAVRGTRQSVLQQFYRC